MTNILRLRWRMTNTLRRRGAIRSRALEVAMRVVPREKFLPGVPLEDVYRDTASILYAAESAAGLPPGSVAQPYTLAVMLEALEAQSGQNVLHVGTGSGYGAALLATLVRPGGRVHSYELDTHVAIAAGRRLEEAGFADVEVLQGDGLRGRAAEAPFDRILVTGSMARVPIAWVQQLAPDGVLVVPIRVRAAAFSVAFDRDSMQFDVLRSRVVHPVTCSPLRETRGHPDAALLPLGQGLSLAGEGLDDYAVAQVATLLDEAPRRVRDVRVAVNEYGLGGGLAFLMAMWEPGMVEIVAEDPARWGFHAITGILDAAHGSLCLMRPDAVVVYGAEAAADRLRAHTAAWVDMGRPGLDRAKMSWLPRSPFRRVGGALGTGPTPDGKPARARLARGDGELEMSLERRPAEAARP
jgi:protein-L-isoaspartate(D-aspartate) O-methyltransferase